MYWVSINSSKNRAANSSLGKSLEGEALISPGHSEQDGTYQSILLDDALHCCSLTSG